MAAWHSTTPKMYLAYGCVSSTSQAARSAVVFLVSLYSQLGIICWKRYKLADRPQRHAPSVRGLNTAFLVCAPQQPRSTPGIWLAPAWRCQSNGCKSSQPQRDGGERKQSRLSFTIQLTLVQSVHLSQYSVFLNQQDITIHITQLWIYCSVDCSCNFTLLFLKRSLVSNVEVII